VDGIKNEKSRRQPLKSAYFQSIFCNLSTMKNSLEGLKKTPQDRQLLNQFEKAARTIMDLAMIHGYEGVEKIAHKIQIVFYRFIRNGSRISPEFIQKADIALHILRNITELEDSLEQGMTVEKCSNAVEDTHDKVKHFTQKITNDFNFLKVKQLELFTNSSDAGHTLPHIKFVGKEQDSPFFDIREPEIVIHINDIVDHRNETMDLFENTK